MAREYLDAIQSGQPLPSAPVCESCQHIVSEYRDLVEMTHSSRCGFCLWWFRLSLRERAVISRSLDLKSGIRFMTLLRRLFRYYPHTPIK